MKDRVWFQSNLSYYKTKDRLLKSRELFSGDMQDWKGRLDFRFNDFKDVTFQITTGGKLGIYYPEEVGYESLLAKVKPFLVKADDTQADEFEKIEDTREEYESIMDCPEFSEVDWRKISKKDTINLYRLWKMGDICRDWDCLETSDLIYDLVRYLLKTHALEKDSESLSKKISDSLKMVKRRLAEIKSE